MAKLFLGQVGSHSVVV